MNEESQKAKPKFSTVVTLLFYPSAVEWMWSYCTYLGPFTDSKGCNYDLGIFMDDIEPCAAIVYGDVPGQYMSGSVDKFLENEVYSEMYNRAKNLKLIV